MNPAHRPARVRATTMATATGVTIEYAGTVEAFGTDEDGDAFFDLVARGPLNTRRDVARAPVTMRVRMDHRGWNTARELLSIGARVVVVLNVRKEGP